PTGPRCDLLSRHSLRRTHGGQCEISTATTASTMAGYTDGGPVRPALSPARAAKNQRYGADTRLRQQSCQRGLPDLECLDTRSGQQKTPGDGVVSRWRLLSGQWP